MKANKPTSSLALTLRRADPQKLIRLQITENTFSSNPQKIVNEFHRKQTYIKILIKFDQTHFTSPLSSIQLPSLSLEQSLEKHITNYEVQTAIKALKPHKRPGPNGFSATFYKRFHTLLLIHFSQVIPFVQNPD